MQNIGRFALAGLCVLERRALEGEKLRRSELARLVRFRGVVPENEREQVASLIDPPSGGGAQRV